MKTLRALAVGLCIVGVAAALAIRFVMPQPTSSYRVRSGFQEMPPNDEPLRAWLAAQPGVTKVVVTRDGRALRIDCEFQGRDRGKAPGVGGKLSEFGYLGPSDFTSWVDP